MAEQKKPQAEQKKNQTETKKIEFAFGKCNYRLLLIGLAFLFLGYILMIGGGSDDPNVFSPALFNFQRLTLAPLLLIIGFVIEIFAIMKRPKETQQ
jgi:hypothetical protein